MPRLKRENLVNSCIISAGKHEKNNFLSFFKSGIAQELFLFF